MLARQNPSYLLSQCAERKTCQALRPQAHMGAANSKNGDIAGAGLKLVVAVDESPASLDTLRWAVRQVLSPKDELHLVTVLDTAHSQQINIAETAPVPDSAVTTCSPEPGALEYTMRFLEKIRSEVVNSEGGRVRDVKLQPLVSCIGHSGDIGRAVIDYAAKQNCDAILVGSRGLGGFKRTMLGMLGLGSVSEYVLRHSPVTVMIHKGHETKMA